MSGEHAALAALLRTPDADDETVTVARRALAWALLVVLAWVVLDAAPEPSTVGAIAAVTLLGGVVLGAGWVVAALDRVVLWWSTRDYGGVGRHER